MTPTLWADHVYVRHHIAPAVMDLCMHQATEHAWPCHLPASLHPDPEETP